MTVRKRHREKKFTRDGKERKEGERSGEAGADQRND